MGQTFNVFVNRDNLLKILVLPIAKDGIVDNYAIYRRVVVRIDEGIFEKLAIDFTEVELEATT